MVVALNAAAGTKPAVVQTVASGILALTSSGVPVTEQTFMAPAPWPGSQPSVLLEATSLGVSLADYGLSSPFDDNDDLNRSLMFIDSVSPEAQQRAADDVELDEMMRSVLEAPL